MVKLRERKYRFWDLKEKRMLYPEETACLFLDQNGKVNHCQVIIDDLSETDRFIPMDWLGITDRNGKDVYEADFVKVNCGEDYSDIGFVEWYHGGFELPGFVPPDSIPASDALEVIGNYFENPELLKENPNG